MIRVEVWASGGGTNADKIIEHFRLSKTVDVVNLACNRRGVGAFSIAEKHCINSTYWSRQSWNPKEILRQLDDRKIDFIVLAGFLKLVPSEVIHHYEGRIVNLHPSLLPKYGGKNMYGENVHIAVLSNQERRTGITIHEANEEFDKGKVLAQFTTSLNPAEENLQSIKDKIQQIEHRHFPPTIEAWILSNATPL